MISCPKCNKELVEVDYWESDCGYSIRNSVYGCDSGCEYVRFEIGCSCGYSYEDGEFGGYDDDEKQEYLDEYLEKWRNKCLR